jgi:hypothetical protein
MIDTHVPSSHPELEALTRRALEHLESLGYKPTSLRQLRHTWKRLCAFAQERSLPDGISEELVDQFLALHRVPGTAAERTSYHRHLRRATGALAAFAVHGTVARRLTVRTPSQIPVPLREAQTRYLTYCATHLGFRPTTLRVQRQHLDAFLGHVYQQGVAQLAEITPGHLSAFIRARCRRAARGGRRARRAAVAHVAHVAAGAELAVVADRGGGGGGGDLAERSPRSTTRGGRARLEVVSGSW